MVVAIILAGAAVAAPVASTERAGAGRGAGAGAARCGATVGVGAGCGAACAPVRVAGVRRAAAVGGLGLHLSLAAAAAAAACASASVLAWTLAFTPLMASSSVLRALSIFVGVVRVLEPGRRVDRIGQGRRVSCCPATLPSESVSSFDCLVQLRRQIRFRGHPGSSRPWIR